MFSDLILDQLIFLRTYDKLTLVLRRGLQQPPNIFRPGAQNRAAKG